jgi:hypothetical protein
MASLDAGSAMHTVCDPLSPLLFVITMEALNSLVALAERRGLFIPLKSPAIRHRMSLYTDDMVVFVAPMDQDVLLLCALLDIFAASSGLHTNISKCQPTPIRCTQE